MQRIGLGFDAHRFADGRKLILGGVEVQFSRGLHGHSDADVILHALADALLGAASLGDIGAHFPDSDPQWKGASSSIFIQRINAMLKNEGWRVVNADITLIAQVPKLEPYREAISNSVAGLLGIEASSISIKATTTDHMGFIGREEGIAAQAIVLIERS